MVVHMVAFGWVVRVVSYAFGRGVVGNVIVVVIRALAYAWL